MTERLRVDPIRCEAYGICAELLPELVELDEWGYPIVDGQPIPAALLAQAREAVALCPRLALTLARPGVPRGADSGARKLLSRFRSPSYLTQGDP
jgi:ferredoxin